MKDCDGNEMYPTLSELILHNLDVEVGQMYRELFRRYNEQNH